MVSQRKNILGTSFNFALHNKFGWGTTSFPYFSKKNRMAHAFCEFTGVWVDEFGVNEL